MDHQQLHRVFQMCAIAGIPLLAAAFDALGLVIVIAIAFISWLVNLANQKPPQPPPVARQPRPRDDKLRNEIDVFLQEVSGRKPKEEPVAIEIVSEDEIRQRRSVKKPLPRAKPPGQPAASAPKPRSANPLPSVKKRAPAATPPPLPRRRPGAEIAERRAIDPSSLGTDLQSHLKQYMAPDRIQQEVQQRITDDVDRRVERNLGSFGDTQQSAHYTPEQARPAQPVSASDVVKLLRESGGMRRAILVNEVLGRPVSLRKK